MRTTTRCTSARTRSSEALRALCRPVNDALSPRRCDHPIPASPRWLRSLADRGEEDARARTPRHVAPGLLRRHRGFDTHDDQLADQPGLLGNVSASLERSTGDGGTRRGVERAPSSRSPISGARSLNGDGADHAWRRCMSLAMPCARTCTRLSDVEIGARGRGWGRFIPARLRS